LDQLQRDALQLLQFSLTHPITVAPLLFPMFRRDQIQGLYDIPLPMREKIWRNRNRPEYQSILQLVADEGGG
jgi:hypothetical protein